MSKTGDPKVIYATAYNPDDRAKKVAGKRTVTPPALGDVAETEQDVKDWASGAQVREQNDMRARLARAQGWVKDTGSGRSHPEDASEV